jgi:hypothetical protein
VKRVKDKTRAEIYRRATEWIICSIAVEVGSVFVAQMDILPFAVMNVYALLFLLPAVYLAGRAAGRNDKTDELINRWVIKNAEMIDEFNAYQEWLEDHKAALEKGLDDIASEG